MSSTKEEKIITPKQCKSARAYLSWSQQDLADKVRVVQKTITDFERGVTTPQRRIAEDIKTIFQEAGIKNYDIQQWWGLLGPANVDPKIQSFINTSVNKALQSEELIKFLATDGGKTKPMSVTDFTALVHDGLKRWAEIAKQTGITAQ
jgi:tripartite-type tricarboxylate transporter receptor subunit TctC